MASKQHQQIVYNTNRAFEAHECGNIDAVDKYRHGVCQEVTDNPLLQGYQLYVTALCEKESERRKELLQHAHTQFMEAGAISAAAATMLDLGRETHADRDALKATRRALDLFRSAGDLIGCSKALSNLGAIHTQLQEYEEASRLLRSAMNMEQSNGDRFGLGISALNLTACLLYMGDTSGAISSAQESISSLQPVHDGKVGALVWQTNSWKKISKSGTRRLADAYVNYGNVLDSLGEYEQAVGVLVRARDLMQSTGDGLGLALVFNQMGQAILEFGDAHQADSCFRESVALLEQEGSRGYMYAIALQSVGEACVILRRDSDALEFFESAISEFAQCGNRVGEAETLLLVADLHIKRNNAQLALPLLEKSLAIGQAISAVEIVVRCNRALGEATMHVNTVQAHQHLQRALLLAEEHSMKREQLGIYYELKSYCKLVGDHTGALTHFEKYHSLHKEIYTEAAERRLRNLEILHRVEQYKASLHEMAGRIEHVERELARKTNELADLAELIMEKQEFVKLVEKGLARLIVADKNKKDDLARELLAEIRETADIAGEWKSLADKFLAINREFAEQLLQLAPDITTTEFRVCVLVRLSMGAKQIADVLGIESKTVFNHQQSIRGKLGLVNRENLKSHLLRLGTAQVAASTSEGLFAITGV